MKTLVKPLATPNALTGMFVGTALFAASLSTFAMHPGKVLHDDANCMKCHASKPYASDTSKVSSFEGLKSTVNFCNNNLNVGWFEDEVEAVAEFLNEKYYKLDQ